MSDEIVLMKIASYYSAALTEDDERFDGYFLSKEDAEKILWTLEWARTQMEDGFDIEWLDEAIAIMTRKQ